jgi:hypothetical protein
MLEDWDPRRPASWIGVLLRGGRDTTWSLVLIPIDLVTVDIGRSNSCSVLLDSPGQTQVAWLTRGAASFERAPSGPCRSRWGGSMRSSSQSVSRASPSGCCAPRRTDSMAFFIRHHCWCPTRWPSDRWNPRRPRDISGDSSWPGLLRSYRSGYRQVPHHHAERLRRRACHARGPGPASTGIVDWSSPPRRTRNALFAGAHLH